MIVVSARKPGSQIDSKSPGGGSTEDSAIEYVNRPGNTIMGHPKGLFLLFGVEMWERFSYYGMRGLLVLYLIAVISLRQLPTGAYTNALEIGESRKATIDGKEREVELTQQRTLHILVGGAAAPAAGDNGAFRIRYKSDDGQTVEKQAPADLKPQLVFQRLMRSGEGDEATWAPDPKDTGDPIQLVGQPGQEFANEEIAFSVSNPTDRTVKLVAGIRRDGTDAKTYFTVNDNSGVFTTEIKPDSKRAPDEKPVQVVIAANAHDSGRNWLKPAATNCQGWYAGLCYLLPLLGGLIADKLIGTHKSMIVGGLLISFGHIALAISGFGNLGSTDLGMDVFVFGMALIVIGTGHFKPSVSVMVGQLYTAHDPRRDGAFTIFYMGINLGAFLCNYVCGTLGQKVGWHWGFGAAAVGMLAGLGMYVSMRPKYLGSVGSGPQGARTPAPIFLLTGIVLAALVALAFHAGTLSQIDTFVSNQYVAGAISLAALIWAIWFTASQTGDNRGAVAAIFIITLFNAFFWLAFEQASTSINVFTEERTNRVIGAFAVPATWFQSINPFLILLGGPLFGILWVGLARMNRNPSQPVKVFYGLLFLGLGYIFMTVAGAQAAKEGAKAAMWLIAATYFLHTVGELCLSPTGLSFVTKTAPKQSVSLLMGVYLMSSFIANLGGAKIAGQVEAIERGELKLPWQLGGQADYFFLFVVTSLVAGVAVLLLTPMLKRMIHGRE
ncbi:MAG: MFS transporter [Planctomycetes bacterium]|nr:MFS transporter [Planctomycetota bacterium]